ncbi:response regulator transcription factor [Streptomyces europaeiscabiei]|uniref:response regulator transcription factor n=1 Tax=Streptomyces europaeiscabiei TaxID=146819 RepID=UPI002E16C416
MIKVLVAADEPLTRAGVKAVVSADPQIEVVAEAADGQETVERALAFRPDVALIDVRLPFPGTVSATTALRRAAPGTAVVMLTNYSEDEALAHALADGASGFLLKTGDPRELLTGVRAVATGAAYLAPEVTKQVIAELDLRTWGQRARRTSRARSRAQALSDRQLEVLSLLGNGLSNAEIGRRLHVVEGTVKSYVSSVLLGLGVRNRVQAAILAYEAGLVEQFD